MRFSILEKFSVCARREIPTSSQRFILFGELRHILLRMALVLLAVQAMPAIAQSSENLTCADVPLWKIIKAQYAYGAGKPVLAYYAGGYIGPVGGSPVSPPPGTVPASYIYTSVLQYCRTPEGWSYHVGIYSPPSTNDISAQGNYSNYPGTSIPVYKLTEQSCAVGNPCSVGSGLKQQAETDFRGTGPQALSLSRLYRSAYAVAPNNGFGALWMHEWQRRLDLSRYYSPTPSLGALRADGTSMNFTLSNDVWSATDGKGDQVIAVSDAGGAAPGFRLTDRRNDRIEDYDADGKLILVKGRNGWATSLKYSDSSTATAVAPFANLLLEVRNQFGHTIRFIYDAKGQINAATMPSGSIVQYGYDSYGMLNAVTYGDGTQRKYHYENTQARWTLTGITDEKGVRFATYGYDSLGRATSTEHAGGVDKFQLSFLGNGETSVTTADGTSRTFTSELQGNVLRATGASAACTACGDIAKAVSYDAAGNVASRRDFADKETRYSYDALGRETQHIEGYGTADAKTTTTEWHPTGNLPIKAAAPGRIDSFEYDANGRVTSYARYPTSDSNGSQGTSGAPAGSIARSIWTYNEQGLLASTVESVDGNATGKWAFTYDPLGNLSSVTTPEGKTGQALRYDSAGRVLEAIDADGNHQQYEYNSRGQIMRYDVAGKTVRYEYDALGFLTAVRGPEGSYIGYEYDDAHHLRAFLLQPEVTETVSTISPFSTAQTTDHSGNVKSARIWQRMWSLIKSWLGALVGNAHAQSSVQRIPVPQAPAMGAPGCNGTGCQQTFLDCLANCIRAYDPLSDEFKVALTGLGGTFPKAMVGLPRGLGGASRMTTVPSALAHGLGGGGAGTVGGAARVVGRVVSPVWIGYGIYLAGMEGYCAADCAMSACSH